MEALSRSASLQRVLLAYLIAIAAAVVGGWFTLRSFDGLDTLYVGLAADVAGTIAIFVFSVIFRNASLYDAYWSVAPIGLAGYWALVGDGDPIRRALVFALVAAWGLRLTYSWARGWPGLHHEDWRYIDLRNKTGAGWPLTNLLGIHFFPTFQVFMGLFPVHAAMSLDGPFGALDAVGAFVTSAAVYIEARSDRELHDFKVQKHPHGTVLNTGLWAYSRHPNYIGETLFWWGLVPFSLAVGGGWWRLSGATAILLMFFFVSIPMIEKRHRERRPNYERDAARGVFFPMPPR